MTADRVAVVDVGMGNLRSVERALEHAAAQSAREVHIVRARDAEALRSADKIVFPGQGAFRDCSRALKGSLGDELKKLLTVKKAPYLGICLGLQILFESSTEAEDEPGLGIFRGKVVGLVGHDPNTEPQGARVKIPHMGWNRLENTREWAAPFSSFRIYPPFVYFVHSYHAVPESSDIIAATVHHGPNHITAAIHKNNITGVQFHPEKSQAAGIALLAEFLRQ